MIKLNSSLTRRALLLTASLALVSNAFAQNTEWPKARPIKIMVAFTAGSGTDVLARAISQEMSQVLGTTVIVENKPGAGGTIAAAALVQAPADGYTILAHSAAHVVNPAIYPKLSYDTIKDISGLASYGAVPFVMVTSPAKGFKDVRDLVRRAQAQPGKMNYGSAGVGSATHLNGAKFASATQIDAVHIPSRGTAEALTETMAGRIDWIFVPATAVMQLIEGGKLQALAVSTTNRADALPNTPSMSEAGFPDAQYTSWAGMFVSAKTPRAITDRLNEAVLRILAMPAVKERMAKIGVTPMPLSASQFDKFIAEEVRDMARLVKFGNVKME